MLLLLQHASSLGLWDSSLAFSRSLLLLATAGGYKLDWTNHLVTLTHTQLACQKV